MDIDENAILGLDSVEIGDRIGTYRTTLLDGRRLLVENGQLVDAGEYPLLAALVPLNYAATETVINGQANTLVDRCCICPATEKLYYTSQAGLDLYEFDFATNTQTNILAPASIDIISSPVCSADGQNILLFAHDIGLNQLWMYASINAGSSFPTTVIGVTSNALSIAACASSDLSISYALLAFQASVDKIEIFKRTTGTPVLRSSISGIDNPVLSDKYVACTGDGLILYVYDDKAIGSKQLWRHDDTPNTNTDITSTLPSTEDIACIGVDKSTGRLYVLFPTAGLFYSDDTGATYTQLPLPVQSNSLCRFEAQDGVVAFFATGNSLDANQSGIYIKNIAESDWCYLGSASRNTTNEARAFGVSVIGTGEGQQVHTHWQEVTEDDSYYSRADLGLYLQNLNDPLAKIVADATGA